MIVVVFDEVNVMWVMMGIRAGKSICGVCGRMVGYNELGIFIPFI